MPDQNYLHSLFLHGTIIVYKDNQRMFLATQKFNIKSINKGGGYIRKE
ncbi:MAG: hypothetical protein U9Q16_02165 [Patescibacteria group bacterium]|nr:hypothetical protein [Patescibacteria group bacterium]